MSNPPSSDRAASLAASDALQLQLQGLRHQVERSTARAARLRVLAVVLGVLVVMLLTAVYLNDLMQYAQLASVDVSAGLSRDAAKIRYLPASSGKVEFVRRSRDRTETLTDYADESAAPAASPREFTWSGQDQGEYSLSVRYRDGLFVAHREWRSSELKAE
jgi:hypothetical protein